MGQRITDKDLDKLCDRINELTESPMRPWGDGEANIGNFHIAHAYGGVRLHRMYNKGGGITTPLGGGYVTKRELYDRLHAYILGMEAAKGDIG